MACGFSGLPSEVGGWNKGWVEGSLQKDLYDPLEMRPDGKERLQQVFCCRAGDETEEREDLQLANLFTRPAWPVDSQGVPAGVRQPGIAEICGRDFRKALWNPPEMGTG